MPFPDSQYPSILRGYDKRQSQRLLAAAPELLAELKRHFPWKENGRPKIPLQGLGIYAEAYAAIAKAEGWA